MGRIKKPQKYLKGKVVRQTSRTYSNLPLLLFLQTNRGWHGRTDAWYAFRFCLIFASSNLAFFKFRVQIPHNSFHRGMQRKNQVSGRDWSRKLVVGQKSRISYGCLRQAGSLMPGARLAAAVEVLHACKSNCIKRKCRCRNDSVLTVLLLLGSSMPL